MKKISSVIARPRSGCGNLEMPLPTPLDCRALLAMTALIILFLLPLNFVFAAQDYYQFTSSEQQNRFATLTSQLRCLVCQNQTLADSNAPLANDLRNQVYQQIQHGQSDQEIIDYLVSRYGNFILYRPPVNALTFGLWFGPFLLLTIGLGSLFIYIKKRAQPK